MSDISGICLHDMSVSGMQQVRGDRSVQEMGSFDFDGGARCWSSGGLHRFDLEEHGELEDTSSRRLFFLRSEVQGAFAGWSSGGTGTFASETQAVCDGFSFFVSKAQSVCGGCSSTGQGCFVSEAQLVCNGCPIAGSASFDSETDGIGHGWATHSVLDLHGA